MNAALELLWKIFGGGNRNSTDSSITGGNFTRATIDGDGNVVPAENTSQAATGGLDQGMEILYGDIGKEAADSVAAETKPRSVPLDIGNEDINPTINDNTSINDASVYANVMGKNVEEKLEWLIKNDPNNAQGWLESLIGIQANNEAINDARAYDKMMADTRVQRTIKDLEAAGINPILASNYLAGASGSVGAAGVPDFSVSTNATSRYNTRLNNEVANNKTLAGIVSALIAAVGLAAKGFISKR